MDPIESLLKQTGWSVDEIRKRLEDYQKKTPTKESKEPKRLDEETTTKSDAKNCNIRKENDGIKNVKPKKQEGEIVENGENSKRELKTVKKDHIKSNSIVKCSNNDEIVKSCKLQDKNQVLSAKFIIEVVIDKNNVEPKSEVIEISDDEGEKPSVENEDDDSNYEFSLDDCEIKDSDSKQPTPSVIKKVDEKPDAIDDIRNQLKRQLELLRSRRDPSTVRPTSSSLLKPSQVIQNSILQFDDNAEMSEIKIVEIVGGYKSPTPDDDFHGYFPDEVNKSQEIVKRVERSKRNLVIPKTTLMPRKTVDITKIKGLKYRNLVNAQIEKVLEVRNQNEDNSSKSSSSNSAFVSEDLENFLTNNSQLNISYEIPSLEAEKSITLTDLLSSNSFPPRSTPEAQTQIQPLNVVQKKQYKPKTLAEKRKLLGIVQNTEEHEKSLTAWREELVNDNNAFPRNKFVKSTNVTNTNSFVLFNGRKIKIASWKNNKILARIQDKPKPIKKPQKLGKSTEVREKPSILKTLKPEPIFFNRKQWKNIKVNLPKVKLDVTPSVGKPADPKIRHFLTNESEILKKKDVDYALTALKDQLNTETFTFNIPFENNQTTFELLQKIPDSTTCSEDDETINESVRKVVAKLLDYVDILDETRDVVYKYADVSECSTASPSPTTSPNKLVVRENQKTSCSVKKTTREMKRLNCKILAVDVEDKSSNNDPCNKEHCKLGCICSSIQGKSIFRGHCKSTQCMFTCNCKYDAVQNVLLSPGTDIFNDGVLNRLEDEAKKDLARVEKDFTHTVIRTNDQIIMIGEKHRKRRSVKPVKYSDFFEDDTLDALPVTSPLRNSEYVAKPYDNEKLKNCSIKLQKHDFSEMIPYCMIHNLYRCYCINQSQAFLELTSIATPSIPYARKSVTPYIKPNAHASVQNHFIKIKLKESPSAVKKNVPTAKKNSPLLSKTISKPSSLKKANKRVVKLSPKSLTFDKEEHTSRTRGVVTTWYLERNRTESHVNMLKRSVKKYEKLLDQYLKENTQVTQKPMSKSLILNQFIKSDDDSPAHKRKQYLANLVSEEDISLEVTSDSTVIILCDEEPLIQQQAPVPKSQQLQNMIQLIDVQPVPKSNQVQNTIQLTEVESVPNSTQPENVIPIEAMDIQPIRPPNSENVLNLLGDQKNLRLYTWSAIMIPPNKPNPYFFWFSTLTPSIAVITKTGNRPSIHHSSVNLFKEIYDVNSLHSDYVRCLVTKTAPIDKKAESLHIIVNHDEECQEIVGFGESNNAADSKMSISITHTGHINLLEIGNPVNKYKCEATDKLVHLNMDNEWKVVLYKKENYSNRSLLFQDTQLFNIVTSKVLEVPVPLCSLPCKWITIYVDETFAYVKLTRNNYTIYYNNLIKGMQLAQQTKQTIILKSTDIQQGYYHRNFGFYFAPNHVDKFFIGPYYVNEHKDLDILKYCEKVLFTIDVYNEKIGRHNQTYYWMYQLPEAGTTTKEDDDDNDVIIIPDTTVTETVDLTNDVQSVSVRKEPLHMEFDKNYCEIKHWTCLNHLMKDEDLVHIVPKRLISAEYFFKRLKNVSNARYIITDIEELGFIPANCFLISQMIDYLHPLKNSIQRCGNEATAIKEVTKLLQSRLIHVPMSFSLNVRLVSRNETNISKQMDIKLLNGYHMVGVFGITNMYKCNKEKLLSFGLSHADSDYALLKHNKRLIIDIIQALIKLFGVHVTPSSTPGTIITAVLKKVVPLLVYSRETGREPSALVTQFYKYCEALPVYVQKKIDYQMSQITQRYQKTQPRPRPSGSHTYPLFIDVNKLSHSNNTASRNVDYAVASTSTASINLDEVTTNNDITIDKATTLQPVIVDVQSLAKPKPLETSNSQKRPSLSLISEHSDYPVSIIPIKRPQTSPKQYLSQTKPNAKSNTMAKVIQRESNAVTRIPTTSKNAIEIETQAKSTKTPPTKSSGSLLLNFSKSKPINTQSVINPQALRKKNLLGEVQKVKGGHRFVINPNIKLTSDQQNLLTDVVKQVYLSSTQKPVVPTITQDTPVILVESEAIVSSSTTNTVTSTLADITPIFDDVIEIEEDEDEDDNSQMDYDNAIQVAFDSSMLQDVTLTSLNNSRGVKRSSSQEKSGTNAKIIRIE